MSTPIQAAVSLRLHVIPKGARVSRLSRGYAPGADPWKPVGSADNEIVIEGNESSVTLRLELPPFPDKQIVVNLDRLRQTGSKDWPEEGGAIDLDVEHRQPFWTLWREGSMALLAAGASFSAALFYRGRTQRRAVLAPAGREPGRIAPWELEPGDRVEDYLVEARLGEGVTAVVYRVHTCTEASGPSLALKLLKPNDFRGIDVMPRFRREMSALAKLRHPAIPYLADFGEFRGMAYLVMELLEGRSLGSRLSEAGPIAGAEVSSLLLELAEVLAFAHRRGVLHRDVKPDNVVFGLDGKARLSDFGLARSSDCATLTTEGTLLGTPAYMAPELVQGERAVAASDQYALGCLGFELLVGTPPFQGESPLAIAVQQMTSPPPPLGEICPDASPGLVAVILRMLEKDIPARFPSLDDVVKELRGV